MNGTIRRECLDHVIVFREAGLSRHLRKFAEYYHRSRTHLGLQKDTPESRPSKHQKLGGSSRSQSWAGSIIATNAAPPEPRTTVELSHGDNVLYGRFIGGAVSPTRSQRSRRRRLTTAVPPQHTDHGSPQYLAVCVCRIGKPVPSRAAERSQIEFFENDRLLEATATAERTLRG